MSKRHPNQSASYAHKMERRKARENARELVRSSRRMLKEVFPHIEEAAFKRKLQSFRIKVKKLLQAGGPGLTKAGALEQSLQYYKRNEKRFQRAAATGASSAKE